MLGAIIGDIVGSRFEWNNIKSKDFEFLTYRCSVTDDSIMSLAITKAIIQSNRNWDKLSELSVQYMQEVGRPYSDCGYGGMFRQWMYSDNPKPYNSYGNGAAMRVSACGFAANSLEEAILLSKKVTEVTHNHPEGIKGAEATAVAIYMARNGRSILDIRDYINNHYYPMDFTLDGIRDTYKFNETCQGTVPQAIMAFLESTDFEDAIRNAISIGGDSDTLAAITGGIAEAYYGIPADIRKHALTFLDEKLLQILMDFESIYPPQLEKARGIKSPIAREAASTSNSTDSREDLLTSLFDMADEDISASQHTAEEITSQQLYSHLYEACNILRGPIGQDEFKSYVTPILFFKRLSDVYDEETVTAKEDYGDDVDRFEEDELHRFVIPDGCHWNDVRQASENIGMAIVGAMMSIERANPDTLFGVFSSFDDANWTDKNKLSDERLKNLIEHMSSIMVGNENYSADIMGDAYEYLIKKFADMSKKNAGEFYTPRTIVKLMVMILDPRPGDTVYDPACGTGGMLIESIHHMNNDKLSYGRIYGQEKNLSTSGIARMNLYLHGANDFHIRKGDTLIDPLFLEGARLKTFDCVIANPPFGLKKWGSERFAQDPYGRNIWGCPSDSSADFAWIQHMVKSMDRKNGRCTVIMPQGVLFHSGAEGKMRQQLIESDKLECVITLAGGIFYGAGVSACILYLNNNKRASHKGKVLLIDASNIYTPKRAQNVMTLADIDEVYKLYTEYEDVIEKSKVVTIEDLRSRDFTLSVSTYIEKKPVATASPEEIRRQFFTALQEAYAAEDKLKELLQEGGYINV